MHPIDHRQMPRIGGRIMYPQKQKNAIVSSEIRKNFFLLPQSLKIRPSLRVRTLSKFAVSQNSPSQGWPSLRVRLLSEFALSEFALSENSLSLGMRSLKIRSLLSPPFLFLFFPFLSPFLSFLFFFLALSFPFSSSPLLFPFHSSLLLRPIRLLRLWISEGLTQANS